MIERMIEAYQSCPLLDFRVEGMGYGESFLFLAALIFAFGSPFVRRKK